MTIFQLECVFKAAALGNFALAAERLYVSQSTIGRQIRQLEEELQVQLFTRDHNAGRLTSIGEALMPEFKKYYEDHKASSRRIQELINDRLHRLRIGIVDSLVLLPEIRDALQLVRQNYPEAQIQICSISFRDGRDLLMTGQMDVVFDLDANMTAEPPLMELRWLRDRMCVAVPSNHPNASLPHISNEEISAYFGDLTFALIDADEFEGPVSTYNKETLPDYESNTDLNKISGPFAELNSLAMLVRSGLGVTCLNELSTLKDDSRVTLIPLVDYTNDGPLEHEVYLNPYWNRTNENEILTAFLGYLNAAL